MVKNFVTSIAFDFISSFSKEKLCWGCDEALSIIFSSGLSNKAPEELIFLFLKKEILLTGYLFTNHYAEEWALFIEI